MKEGNKQIAVGNIPSRRQFINKAGLVAGGAILGYITLLNACNILEPTKTETTTQSQPSSYALPEKISRIENLPEVIAAVRTEKEQLSSFSDELQQFQLEMNELDSILVQLDRMNEVSEEMSLRLQMAMDRRSKFISTLSQMMKKISTTQDILVQNIK
ncbi:hypothetical protein ACFLUX_02165 [Chloroflexota bacterium]